MSTVVGNLVSVLYTFSCKTRAHTLDEQTLPASPPPTRGAWVLKNTTHGGDFTSLLSRREERQQPRSSDEAPSGANQRGSMRSCGESFCHGKKKVAW